MADLEENRDTGRNVEPLRPNPPDPTCPLLENRGPLGIVGELAGFARRMQVRVECRFADVDADILGYAGLHLFQVLCLSCGPKARVSVQATGKREGRSHSSPALNGQQFRDPSLPAADEFAARRRRPIRKSRQLHKTSRLRSACIISGGGKVVPAFSCDEVVIDHGKNSRQILTHRPSLASSCLVVSVAGV